MNYKMAKILLYTFETKYKNVLGNSIPILVFMDNLPSNSTATVHSTLEFGCSWFIAYSVRSGDGHTELFYELVEDSDESNDYVLNISYDSSTRKVCSFDSREQITFVDRDNNVVEKPQQMLYEYVIEDRMSREFKIYLVIYNNNIVLFWNDECAKITVKTFDLSSFFSSREYGNFTRVEFDIDDLTDERCEMTFYTESPGNRYFSAYLDINPLSNKVCVVLKDYEFNQMCDSSLSGSQFKPETCHTRWRCTLELTHYVDGKLQKGDSDAKSDNDSEEESDAGSEEESDADD